MVKTIAFILLILSSIIITLSNNNIVLGIFGLIASSIAGFFLYSGINAIMKK